MFMIAEAIRQFLAAIVAVFSLIFGVSRKEEYAPIIATEEEKAAIESEFNQLMKEYEEDDLSRWRQLQQNLHSLLQMGLMATATKANQVREGFLTVWDEAREKHGDTVDALKNLGKFQNLRLHLHNAGIKI